MRVLILEDDPLTALDLQIVVEETGHDVVGPCETLAAAGRCLGEQLDLAFLDIDLPDGKSFGLARQLADMGVPFCFVSASTRADLPEGLRHVCFIAKPYQHAAIRASLLELTSVAA